ncbi:ATP-dependent DNA helicase mph1 [Plakobranchus ocellatus]|uniref:ATP-dependent DNA helicase mph1 n=1 Tax=Plakobranchus ocellatus TaxID=259542 RepID=A0AAV4AGD7_9GAST|nr:ATP-dependent DNA helicase mph1 [Plakobranchus ocellatus]
MDYTEQDFGDEDDELLACVDVPNQENHGFQSHYHKEDLDLDHVNFEDYLEEENPSNISTGACEAEHSNKDGGAADSGPGSGSPGFDFTTGKLWIYPTNYPVRDYQYNIVQQALFKNTLVVLPTGLGKTFIAAVVMYNYYRWFPHGKVVFMAPTKPLVAQQMQACYNIMGIPKSDTIEMTGTMHPGVRQRQWKEKRVIFLTPQVMTNDLSRGSCEARSFKCLVVDEAHKALGNQSYCQVIRELCKFTSDFRVLALSATPGSTLKAVQTVMHNLLVSHIELRTEDSIDIKPYTHERKVEKVVVPLGEELSAVKEQYIQIMTFVTQRLTRNRALYNMEATRLSKFLLLKARDEFRQNPPQNIQPAQKGTVEADFCLAISLYHGYDLLQLHGLRSLYNFLMGIVSGEKGYGRTRAELLRNADFNSIMDRLHNKFAADANATGSKPDIDGKVVVGHPKMQVLEKIVVEHFQSYENKSTATKVVIFSQFRDSVQEIATILNQHQPLVKVMPFIGQSSSGKDIKGFTQKEQLEVMRQFREAGCNTLVSTCVGEEGLDIGDVDLIICFDAHKSPIRLVQRMGRTGRKREGKIVMLVTEGKEEQIYNQSLSSKKSIHKAILNGAKSLKFFPNNPRMVPVSVKPQCHKMYITIPEENKRAGSSSGKKNSTTGKRRQTIADAFKKQGTSVSPGLDCHLMQSEFEEIMDEFAMVPSTAKHLPKPKCLVLTRNASMPTQEMSEASDTTPEIKLSEWTPWQNRLQKTFFIGHSIQSQHLVKNSEFIEVQRVVGEDEDNYAIEMKQFVTQSFISQSNITSFLLTPAKAEGKGLAIKGAASSSTHRNMRENGGESESLFPGDADPESVDSSDSDSGTSGGKLNISSKQTSKARSSLATLSRAGKRKISKGKKNLFSLHSVGKSKRKSSQSASVIGTPSSSTQSRIQLVKKSRKTLQKRKSSVSRLLESKLTSVVQENDKDDFENISQAESAPDALSDVHGETTANCIAQDKYEEVQDEKDCDKESNGKSPSLENTILGVSKNVIGDCDIKHEAELHPPPYKHGQTLVGLKNTRNRETSDVSGISHMVPPAPAISDMDDLVAALSPIQHFGKLDLDLLLQDWGQLNWEGNVCANFNEKCSEFSVQRGKSIGKKSESTSYNLLQTKVDNLFAEALHASLANAPESQSSVTMDLSADKDQLTCREDAPAVSPIFNSSGRKMSHKNPAPKTSMGKRKQTTENITETCNTGYGNANNPVVISPEKCIEKNTVMDSPRKIIEAGRVADSSGKNLQISQAENNSLQDSASFITVNKHGLSPSDEISFSPLAEDKNSKRQHCSKVGEDQLMSDVIVEKGKNNKLQGGHLAAHSSKSSAKKTRFSQSFITFTQAHECLMSSSSENSREADRNESPPTYGCVVNCSPMQSPSPAKLRKEKPQLKSDTPKWEKSLNLTPGRNSATNLDNQKHARDSFKSVDGEINKVSTALVDKARISSHPQSREKIVSNSYVRPVENPGTSPKPGEAVDDDDSILAQFDLGFDLDDVIPPTPDKESPSVAVVSHGVRRPLFSESNKDHSNQSNINSNMAAPSRSCHQQHENPDLPSPSTEFENNIHLMPLDIDDPESEYNHLDVAENIQSNFDLGAEFDDLDPLSEKLEKQSVDGDSNEQTKSDSKTCSPHGLEWPASQGEIKNHHSPSGAAELERDNDDDFEPTHESPPALLEAKLIFSKYKTDPVNEKVNPTHGLSLNNKVTPHLDASNNKYISKPSKLKLGKRKENNPESKKLESNPGTKLVKQGRQNAIAPISPKSRRPKIRFNLRVPDFSDSDDDIIFLDAKNPSCSTPTLDKPSRDESTSSSKRSSSNSLSPSPVQDFSNSPTDQAKFSASQVSSSTPVRPLGETRTVSNLGSSKLHTLTPIPASPQHGEYKTPAIKS